MSGIFFGIFAGSLAVGVISARLGVMRVLLLFVLLQSAGNLFYFF
jgi:hypothetical protein